MAAAAAAKAAAAKNDALEAAGGDALSSRDVELVGAVGTAGTSAGGTAGTASGNNVEQLGEAGGEAAGAAAGTSAAGAAAGAARQFKRPPVAASAADLPNDDLEPDVVSQPINSRTSLPPPEPAAASAPPAARNASPGASYSGAHPLLKPAGGRHSGSNSHNGDDLESETLPPPPLAVSAQRSLMPGTLLTDSLKERADKAGNQVCAQALEP
jgi:hypothetical protein